jgi:dolichol-phosphate mannosyltransferase
MDHDLEKTDYSDTTVIIPTINEERNIGRIIDIIKKLYRGISIIVADDGSTDRTCEIARTKGARVLDRRNEKKGLSASVIHAATIVKTRYFVVIDGDLQHPPETIKEIVALLRKGFPVAVGARERVDSRWPLFRRLESKTAMGLGRLKLIGRSYAKTDLMSGFFGCETGLFNDTHKRHSRRFVPEGFKVLFDFLKCLPQEVKVGEAGYIFGARSEGESKIRGRHVYYYLKSLVK